MRVVVVDDMLPFEDEVASALGVLGALDGPYLVTGARSPADLAVLLRGESFDLAFVDMSFGKRARDSGLTALRILEEHQVPSVVYWNDTEHNRALFVLAAFQFFRPVTLIPKTTNRPGIRAVVDTLAAGRRHEMPGLAHFLPPSDGPSLLDRLVVSSGELGIWRALTVFGKRPEIARESGYTPGRVDKFLRDRFDAMLDTRKHLFGSSAGGEARDEFSSAPEGRTERLAPMHAFAREHLAFFRDEELARLVRARERR